MKEYSCDVAVIGGGAAGLAAATAAREAGAEKVLVIERDRLLGGILPQCIHSGFGLVTFKEDLTGPEYIHRFTTKTAELKVEARLNTLVLEVRPDRRIIAASASEGMIGVKAGAVVLAMGCRERTRGALAIPGTRPAGVFTAGQAQRFVNIEGYMPGERVVILGSGDVGMIMARRLTFEGAKVEAVVEVLPYVGGLMRNKVQCLDDFGIPLLLKHTVTRICGNQRLTGVMVAQVDGERRPVPGTERLVECDTLLLSVGLIPENELTEKCGIEMDQVTGGAMLDERMETGVPGIFACGNVVHVCDIVDNVTAMGLEAGREAAKFASGGGSPERDYVSLVAGENVRYIVPQRISRRSLLERNVAVHLRVAQPGQNVRLSIKAGGEPVFKAPKKAVHPGEALIGELSPQSAEFFQKVGELVVDVEPLVKK